MFEKNFDHSIHQIRLDSVSPEDNSGKESFLFLCLDRFVLPKNFDETVQRGFVRFFLLLFDHFDEIHQKRTKIVIFFVAFEFPPRFFLQAFESVRNRFLENEKNQFRFSFALKNKRTEIRSQRRAEPNSRISQTFLFTLPVGRVSLRILDRRKLFDTPKVLVQSKRKLPHPNKSQNRDTQRKVHRLAKTIFSKLPEKETDVFLSFELPLVAVRIDWPRVEILEIKKMC